MLGAGDDKAEKLIEAWERLVRSMANKEGLTREEARRQAKKYFPELYWLYKKANKEKLPDS